MRNSRQLGRAALLLLCALLISCTGSDKTVKLGLRNSLLTPCPASPNCVSSDAEETGHRVAPFPLAVPSAAAWSAAQAQVAELPRTKIITATEDYLHAECRSALFGFVDDLELHLRPAKGIIAVRSAARMGHSDFGVNRQRVETLRAALLKQGTIR